MDPECFTLALRGFSYIAPSLQRIKHAALDELGVLWAAVATPAARVGYENRSGSGWGLVSIGDPAPGGVSLVRIFPAVFRANSEKVT
ncbi:MAG: hypothetical protein RLZZ444_3869 [Pseudomonadota bacterium]|jgi:hypothetical protein